MLGRRRAGLQLVASLILIAAAWWGSWHPARIGGGRRFAFFALWLGYIGAIDALVLRRTGSSPSRRGVGNWLLMFLASVPVWWSFEVLNRFLGNWEYVSSQPWAPLERFLLSSLCFSTVIPAVFTTAELVASFGAPAWLARRPPLDPSPRVLARMVALGIGMLGGILVAPRFSYPTTWLCLLFLLDPLNEALGAPSVVRRLAHGDWRPIWYLASAALVCGVFWELWNYRADPKWIYHIPFFGRGERAAMPYVFEMPLPGYLGYLPFGVELYATYTFLMLVIGRSGATVGPQFGAPEGNGASPDRPQTGGTIDVAS